MTGAEQVEGLKTLWDLTLQPSGNGSVFILTPLNRACTEAGALCTADGGTLTVAPALQVAGPPPPQVNNPATGAPTVTGTAQVGETLSADTSAIADADGLANVSYSYQWIRNDGSSDSDITGATDSTYALVDADEGKTIKVKVGFTDDAGSDESLASAATASVAAHPDQGSAPDAPDQPVGTAVFAGGVDLEWNDVPGADSYDVQLFRNGQWMDLPGDGVEIAFYGAGGHHQRTGSRLHALVPSTSRKRSWLLGLVQFQAGGLHEPIFVGQTGQAGQRSGQWRAGHHWHGAGRREPHRGYDGNRGRKRSGPGAVPFPMGNQRWER